MYNGDGIFLRGRAGVGKGQRAFHFCASDNNLAVFFSKLRSRSGESALGLCEWNVLFVMFAACFWRGGFVIINKSLMVYIYKI